MVFKMFFATRGRFQENEINVNTASSHLMRYVRGVHCKEERAVAHHYLINRKSTCNVED